MRKPGWAEFRIVRPPWLFLVLGLILGAFIVWLNGGSSGTLIVIMFLANMISIFAPRRAARRRQKSAS